MSCRRAAFAAALAIALGLGAGCARAPAPQQAERLAVLRFENLSGDASADWMGRAFAELVSTGATNAPGVEVIPGTRIHAANVPLGIRPISAPGISSERTMAVAAGANRLAYGDYSLVNGRWQARLTIEDQQSGKMTRVISGSGPNVVAVSAELVRQLSPAPVPYGTTNIVALKAWSQALEASDAGALRQDLEQAIAADPDFGPPYRALAEWKAQRQDRAGAAALLEQALARGNRIPEVERSRIQVELATLRNDAATQQQALANMLRLDPRDAQGWRALAQTAWSHRDCAQAAQAYQKVLELQPTDANSQNQLAYASACNGDLDTAVRVLRQYQSQRPTDPNALDSLGDVNLIAGRLKEAEGFYLDALKKDPNFLNNMDSFKAAMARLMTGDVAGADAFAKQYADARAAAHDPTAGVARAEWSWISGRRKQGYAQLMEFARANENGPQRELASRAYSELAIWSLMLGDRAGAGQLAQKSAPLAGRASLGLSLVARYLALPSAPAAEWAARADKLFPNAPPHGVRDLTVAYALLIERQFQPASALLKGIYGATPPGSDEGAPYLLAWTLLETGQAADAAPLLRANPVPPRAGVGPTMSFYFPRIYYLRGLAAEKQGRTAEARDNYRLFLKLSGDTPFAWGEEQKARAAAQ